MGEKKERERERRKQTNEQKKDTYCVAALLVTGHFEHLVARIFVFGAKQVERTTFILSGLGFV